MLQIHDKVELEPLRKGTGSPLDSQPKLTQARVVLKLLKLPLRQLTTLYRAHIDSELSSSLTPDVHVEFTDVAFRSVALGRHQVQGFLRPGDVRETLVRQHQAVFT